MSNNGRIAKLSRALGGLAERPGYVEARDMAEAEQKLAELPPGFYKLYLGGFGPSDWDEVDDEHGDGE